MLGYSLLSVLLAFSTASNASAQKICRVTPLAGGKDSGPLILDALSPSQCGQGGKVVLDGFYVVDTVLATTGLKNVEIELSGTIQYTTNMSKWTKTSIYMTFQNATTAWFLSGQNINLHGGPKSTGTIDGNGQAWWDAFATNHDAGAAGGSSRTFARPVPLTVGNATNVTVAGIHMIAPPFWTNFVYQSKGVTYDNITITVKSNSKNPPKNTDGWDIYRSDGVTIKNSVINNDDDCVAFKPNSTNIVISNLSCNGSHGISVGSLGQYAGETDIVANVLVDGVKMINAQNGARIKVWSGSPDPKSITGGGGGYVKNITFANFENKNVDSPIVIDQCYMTTAAACAKYPSPLSISDIHYINVTGTSSGSKKSVVASLTCAAGCKDITATGTSLKSPNAKTTYVCKNIDSVSSLDFPCTSS